MSSKPLKPGFRLGKYEVQAHLATGGMSTVYKALDTELQRTVALKVLPPLRAEREGDLKRFHREARLSARLSYKHIVTLFEYNYDDRNDLHYLAMEFVDGIDLDKHIERKGRLQPEETRRILIQAAKALDHAFTHGVVHRDIKPSNFLLAQVGNKVIVKLTDLGLALVHGVDDYKVTTAGSTVGTVDYMSPEQARDSRAIDIRSDIYSLGCTAFHMLAGRPPFADGGLGERVFKHIQEPPPDVRQFSPTVSEAFWAVLKKMMAKKPDERYQTPAELLDALNTTEAEAPEPPAAPTSPLESSDPHRKTEIPPPAATPSAVPTLATPDEAKRAAAFHERALQVMSEGGGDEYPRQLLANALKLDPFNLAYHKALREVNRKAPPGLFGRLFGSLNLLAMRSKLKLARSSGDFRKVLEQGEDILARQPADVDTHLEMGLAAGELGLHELAIWLFEQGREHDPEDTRLMRALARQYETGKEWKRALKLWEKVQRREPDDGEVRKKINDLSIEDTIERGNYRR
jgi:serine/threonine protein kinase